MGWALDKLNREEEARRAYFNQPIEGDVRDEPPSVHLHYQTPSDLSADFLTASEEFAQEWRAEELYQSQIRSHTHPDSGR